MAASTVQLRAIEVSIEFNCTARPTAFLEPKASNKTDRR